MIFIKKISISFDAPKTQIYKTNVTMYTQILDLLLNLFKLTSLKEKKKILNKKQISTNN